MNEEKNAAVVHSPSPSSTSGQTDESPLFSLLILRTGDRFRIKLEGTLKLRLSNKAAFWLGGFSAAVAWLAIIIKSVM